MAWAASGERLQWMKSTLGLDRSYCISGVDLGKRGAIYDGKAVDDVSGAMKPDGQGRIDESHDS